MKNPVARLLNNATLYELVQVAAGSRVSDTKMRELIGPVAPGTRILDAGGGTGIVARLFDCGRDYCCMDIDLARVRVALARGASGIQGDVAHMPIRGASVDIVVLRAISHHLVDEDFDLMVAESRRVMKLDGRLIFMDAVLAKTWLPGRLMWRIDQGSHPRSEQRMTDVLEAHFKLERRATYSVFHRYLLAEGRPRTTSGSAARVALATHGAV